MGWFDEQIRVRIQSDDDRLSDSLIDLAMAANDGSFTVAGNDSRKKLAALSEILRYYRLRERDIPKNLEELDDQLDFLLRPAGILRRRIRLTNGWYKDAIGPILGIKNNGTMAALLPHPLGGYQYFDYDIGANVRINAATAKELDDEAFCFYRPLPQKKLGIADLLRYLIGSYEPKDLAFFMLMTFLGVRMTMLTPKITEALFSQVIPSGVASVLLPLAVLSIGIAISTALLELVKSVATEHMSTKTDIEVQAAAMMRLLSLPADFFRKYPTGELSARLTSLQTLCGMLADTVMSSGVTGLFSLMYVEQIFQYAPSLVIPAIIIVFLTVMLSVLSSFLRVKVSRKIMEGSARESGLVYSLITGIQKIRLAGAEKRAYAKWAKTYAVTAKNQYDPPAVLKYGSVIQTAVSQIGIIVLYFIAIKTAVPASKYMAFTASYGLFLGAFTTLASAISTAANIQPVLTMVKPILEAVPEISENKIQCESLHGGVELNNVSFRYAADGPLIVDNLSLKIRPGQYVAIVGKTGCGKSTLIRLLLGFEKPQKGAIYYDGKDINQLDLPSLRRNIGVVLQDGKLFPGDIFSNITISAPWMTVDEAWEAAAMAGVDKDIEDMPMGMNTLITDGGGGVSGGQAQRLMIARAIAPKPKVLIFDEATSALDNLTQKQVTQSLDSLKCTRIVVAHRLSTIRSCNRILVLDQGRIVEDGSYDALMQKENGIFRELVKRQQLNAEAE